MAALTEDLATMLFLRRLDLISLLAEVLVTFCSIFHHGNHWSRPFVFNPKLAVFATREVVRMLKLTSAFVVYFPLMAFGRF